MNTAPDFAGKTRAFYVVRNESGNYLQTNGGWVGRWDVPLVAKESTLNAAVKLALENRASPVGGNWEMRVEKITINELFVTIIDADYELQTK